MTREELLERFEDTLFNGTVVDYTDVDDNRLKVFYDNGDVIEFYTK